MMQTQPMTRAQKLMESMVRVGTRTVYEDTHPAILDMVLGRDREGYKARTGAGAVDFDAADFSFKSLREAMRDLGRTHLREANSSGMLGQLLRADTQRIMDSWFTENMKNLSYLQICATVNSNKRQEFYNPLHTAQVQSRTPELTPYGESTVKGEDIPLVNEAFTGGESFSRQLFDDDLTGQIRGRQQDLAEAAIRTLEIYFAFRFLASGGTFGPLQVTASNWPNLRTSVNQNNSTLSGVFTTDTATGLGNRLGTFTQLSVPGLKEAVDLLERMKDLQGNLLGLSPDTLFISTKDRINASIMANSQYYPAAPGRGGENTAVAPGVASGFFGGAFSQNPFVGAYNVVVNRYLTAWAWALGMAGRGIVFQMRDPIEVQQEVPMAGKSYELSAIRLKTWQRFQIDWTDPRFWILGNDGSAVGTF